MIYESESQINKSYPKSKMELVEPQKSISEVNNQEPEYDYRNIVTIIFFIVYQVIVTVMYGLFYTAPASKSPISSLNDVMEIGLLFILTILAFGLIFGHYHNVGWTALGFNLLITALCIETYFLANSFFAKTNIYTDQVSFADTNRYQIFLSAEADSTHEATLREAIKCSLSCIIAFSCVIGRIGIFQVFLLSVLGTFGYELSRVLGLINNDDDLGTFKIFGYGGAMGLIISLVLRCNEVNLKNHKKLQEQSESQIFTFLGIALFIVIFPLMVKDNISTLFQNYQLVPIFQSICIATISGITFSFFYGGFLTFLTCTLAGGIAVLSSVPYIDRPYLALVIGSVSAILQYVMLAVDKCISVRWGRADLFRYVFLFQGILGTFWGLLSKAVFLEFNKKIKKSQAIHFFGAGWISIGIGFGVGLTLGIIFSIIAYNEQNTSEYFYDDTVHWNEKDGIRSEDARDSEISLFDDPKKEIIEKYEFKEYSNIKQTHSVL